jgi:NADPH:quinone reductase-like Zn-dependent oxidoreductase
MKALALKLYGGPDQAAFADILRLVPNPDEILVRVHAAGLNPVDNKIRDGQMKAILRFQLPATLGSDLAGVVVEVGHRVTRFKPGDAVFASIFGLRTLDAFVLSEERMAVCPISGSYVNQGPNRRYLLRHELKDNKLRFSWRTDRVPQSDLTTLEQRLEAAMSGGTTP